MENSKFLLKNLNLTTVSLDFYSGAINAINMVKKTGINLEVDASAIRNNSTEVNINRLFSAYE